MRRPFERDGKRYSPKFINTNISCESPNHYVKKLPEPPKSQRGKVVLMNPEAGEVYLLAHNSDGQCVGDSESRPI
jgi:hypothetical protein